MSRPPIDRKTLGRVIRAFRKKARLTQRGLGARADLQKTYVSDIEVGRRNPSFVVLDRLLLALTVTWEEFGRELERAAGERSQ